MSKRTAKVMALTIATMLVTAAASAQDAIRFGTSSVGSLFYTLAIGASEVIHKHAKLNVNVEPVGGSTASLHSLGAKKIEMAMANSFASFSAYHGRYKFKKPVDVRLVIKGQPNYRGLVVRKKAGIRLASDLKGRIIIGKRRALPENEMVMRAMMKAMGLSDNSVKLVATTNSPQMYKALRAGSVDGAIIPFSPRSAALLKPMHDGVIEFFDLPKDKRDVAMTHVPKAFYTKTFKLGTFKGQKKPIHSFGLSTYLISRPDISNDTIYKVVKAIDENTKEFTTYHKAARLYTGKRTLAGFKLPLHDGAIRYFKEKGTWTAAHAKRQADLLASR
jgi:TRAP transporter TAXI family solute receptor